MAKIEETKDLLKKIKELSEKLDNIVSANSLKAPEDEKSFYDCKDKEKTWDLLVKVKNWPYNEGFYLQATNRSVRGYTTTPDHRQAHVFHSKGHDSIWLLMQLKEIRENYTIEVC